MARSAILFKLIINSHTTKCQVDFTSAYYIQPRMLGLEQAKSAANFCGLQHPCRQLGYKYNYCAITHKNKNGASGRENALSSMLDMELRRFRDHEYRRSRAMTLRAA